MRFDEEDKTFTFLRPDHNSIKSLLDYYKSVPNLQPDRELHTTIIESELDGIEIPIIKYAGKTFKVDRNTFEHRIIKNKEASRYSLILVFYNKEIEEMHKDLVRETDVRHKYYKFLQHITISYNLGKWVNPKLIPLPKFDLVLGELSSYPINIDFLEEELNNIEW